jgi:hypothetical protein
MARKKKSTADAPMSPDMDRWRAKDDLRTLSSAAEIARDKARMRAAKSEAQRQMKALATVAGKAPADKMSRRKRLEKVEL